MKLTIIGNEETYSKQTGNPALEGTIYVFNSFKIPNSFLILLWWKTCVKLENKVISRVNKVSGTHCSGNIPGAVA